MGESKSINWLISNINSPNIAPDIDPSALALLGSQVVQGYEIDVASRADWQKLTEAGLKIAMQVIEPKTYPWPGCANVKHPLIATAAIQFAARAYPEIVKGVDVVKARVVGEDPQGLKEKRAKRVSEHMSWQCTEGMPEWDEDTDKLLHSLPIMGICYRKTYWDTMYQRNASEGRSALQVVVNHKTKNLEKCRRITDEVWLYKNEVIERERAGLFAEETWKQLRGDDEEKPQELFLEQHCWADLDGDGYEEPYIVTVHRESGVVARVVARYDEAGIIRGTNSREVARIEPVHYFTKYGFIPAPDGSFHDLGFAQLLSPLNETMNTILNQLIDAGTLHNLGGGFVGKGVKWQGGKMTFIPGEWKNVDVTGGVLKDNVVPLPTKEPSAVLFQLLGLISEAANRLASVSETMTGETPGQNVPATTVLAMIEQGLKVFTSIYKRVYRSLKSEYKKLYRLNRLYLGEEEYYRVLDDGGAVFRADYESEDLDIVPVADPTISSEAQRLARARAQYETMGSNPSIGGRIEILRRYYEALKAPDIDKLMPPEEMQKIAQPGPPLPNPAILKLEADITKQKHDYELAIEKMGLDRMKLEADIQLIKAQAIAALATAESKEVGQQFELYKHNMETLTNFVKIQMDAHQRGIENAAADADRKIAAGEPGDNAGTDAGGAGGVEGASGDEGSDAIPAGGPGGLPGAVMPGGNMDAAISGADGATDLAASRTDLRAGLDSGNPMS